MTAVLALTAHEPDAGLTLDYRYGPYNVMRNELILAGWTLHISKRGNHSQWRTPEGLAPSGWYEHAVALETAHRYHMMGGAA